MEHRIFKIGVISDTHGLLRSQVKDILKECDAILHGGDVGGRDVMDELEQIAKVYAVRGNNDRVWELPLPEERSFTLFRLRFYMVHDKKQIPSDLTDVDFVIYGHSHMYEIKQEGDTVWLNPGGCGYKRFHYPVTMAVIEVDEKDGSFQVRRLEF